MLLGLDSSLPSAHGTVSCKVPCGTLLRSVQSPDGGARDWLAQARRGVIELCVLALIDQTPHYGYELTTALGALGSKRLTTAFVVANLPSECIAARCRK